MLREAGDFCSRPFSVLKGVTMDNDRVKKRLQQILDEMIVLDRVEETVRSFDQGSASYSINGVINEIYRIVRKTYREMEEE
jgi:hypothetical protein